MKIAISRDVRVVPYLLISALALRHHYDLNTLHPILAFSEHSMRHPHPHLTRSPRPAPTPMI